jgi:hypothetical protein
METFINYVVEMGSDTLIYVPNSIKTGSGIKNVVWEDT